MIGRLQTTAGKLLAVIEDSCCKKPVGSASFTVFVTTGDAAILKFLPLILQR
jgi:hypothetical protein